MTIKNNQTILSLNKHSLHFIFMCLCFVLNPNIAQGAPSLVEFSVLPENFVNANQQAPNILLVLDNSGSMRANVSNAHVGADLPSSRSYQVRQTLREFMTESVEDKESGLDPGINIGLMTFGGKPVRTGYRTRLLNCAGYPGCVNPVYLWNRNLTGKGTLLQNVRVLNRYNLNRMNTFLATEPKLPVTSPNYWPNYWGYFRNSSSFLENNVVISQAGTPLTGSLESAYRYYITHNLNTQTEVEPIAGTVAYPPNINLNEDCQVKSYVFLLTDGLPTINRNGQTANSNTEVTVTATAAKRLHDAGVETWVFGYAIDNASKANINTIALAGSGNKRGGFFASSSEDLKKQLDEAIESIKRNNGSSSGLSVVANSNESTGSLVQAIYKPEINDTVFWTSTLSSFFIDQYGYLREDNTSSGTRGKLDDYNIDFAFRSKFDEVSQTVKAQRFIPQNIGNDNDFSEQNFGLEITLDELNPIWEANKQLSNYSNNLVYSSKQRALNNVASDSNGYRRIFTWLQDNPSNTNFEFDKGKLLNFIVNNNTASESIGGSNYTLLDAGSYENTKKIVRFIRGEENIPQMRTRTDGNNRYLLGDIIHSTASQVDKPSFHYDTFNNDSSYSLFKDQYKHRRRVVYVGANDGFLHAFNGGFWDGTEQQFNLAAPDGSDNVRHALGAELWAYAPMNLLPHLKYLANQNYNADVHIAYMDGPVQIFDIKAFTPSSKHVAGWGTILVAGMRFGGGQYDGVNPDAKPTNNKFSARSAYVVLDITDPRQDPVVIGEITHPKLGFTLSQPTVSKQGDDWYLVFGSGPTQLSKSVSNQQARLFRYKLNEGSRGFDSSFNGNQVVDDSSQKSFIGDIISHDWNGDYSADAIYFGTIDCPSATNIDSCTEANQSGGMYRYSAELESVNLLHNTSRPVIHRAHLKSISGKDWVFFGSGRYLTTQDAKNNQQNKFYGIAEPTDSTGIKNYISVQASNLLDVTNIEIKSDGSLVDTDNNVPNNIKNFVQLKSYILDDSNDKSGWFSNFESATPSRKLSAPALSFKNLLFYSEYKPPVPADTSVQQCSIDYGKSYLNVVDLVTGTASYYGSGASGNQTNSPLGSSNDTLIRKVEIGSGYAHQSYLHIGVNPKTDNTAISIKVPLNTGEISTIDNINLPVNNSGRQSWRELQIQ